jgi:putative FmdB family regulatory protein
MPLYEYRCTTCDSKFEKLLSMSAADRGVNCPDCGADARRLVSTFAAFKKGESGQVSSVGGGGCAGCAGGSCASCGH